MARGASSRPSQPLAASAASQDEEEDPCCPLCISPLDETEACWLPCPCAYQLCLFCFERIQKEFNNQCPGCRTPYDLDFEAGLRRARERAERERQEAAQLRQQQRTEAAEPGPASRTAAAVVAKVPARKRGAAVVAVVPASRGGAPAPPAPPPQPERDLHIEEEQAWPSLGAAALPTGPTAGPSGRKPLPRVATSRPRSAASPAAVSGSEPSSSSAADSGSSSTSSGTTTATTPQSPADSVVLYRAALPPAPLHKTSVFGTAPGGVALQGQCHVALQAGGLGAQLDPEGASLCVSLQEAVRLGTIGVKQAAASLASYLRRKHAAPSSALWSSGASAGEQAASPFHTAGYGLLSLSSSGPPEGLDASLSVATASGGSASLAGWASGTSAGAGAISSPRSDGGSPVRRAGKLPLYARTNTSTVQPAAGFPGFPAALGTGGAARGRLGKLAGRVPPPGFSSLPRFNQ